jgi:hypothetical protein
MFERTLYRRLPKILIICDLSSLFGSLGVEMASSQNFISLNYSRMFYVAAISRERK